LSLKGVIELVYGKVVHIGDYRLSLRVYTAVNPGGESRGKGTDAIRVQLFHKVQNGGKEQILPVGRPQKCLRVASWRDKGTDALGRSVQGAFGLPLPNQPSGKQTPLAPWPLCSMLVSYPPKRRNGERTPFHRSFQPNPSERNDPCRPIYLKTRDRFKNDLCENFCRG
jgi:hypothetical protein